VAVKFWDWQVLASYFNLFSIAGALKKMNLLYLQKHFDNMDNEFGSRIGNYLTKEVQSHCENFYNLDYLSIYFEKGKKGFEDYICDFVVEKKVDFVFFVPLSHDVTIDPLFFKRLHQLTKVIMQFTDGEYYFEKIHRYYAQLSDLTLYAGNYNLKIAYDLLDINALYFKGLYDTDFYGTQEPCKKDIDVSFVGTINQASRRKYIEYLESNGVVVEQFGQGTKNGVITFDEMTNTYKRSKISLHFTSLSYPNNFIIFPPLINQRIKQHKGRLCEVPLSGGFMLTEYMPDMEEYYKVGEECGVFYSKEDLLGKIKYYLEHDAERELIAKRGHQRALKDWNVRAGVNKLFDVLRDLKKSNATTYLDNEFLELYSNKRFYYVSYFLANAEFGKLMHEIKVIVSNLRCFSLRKAFLFFLAGITETVLGEKIRRPFRKFKFYGYLRSIPRY
jgi:hypothetical protein